MELFTGVLPSETDQPIEQSTPIPVRAGLFLHDQVINVKELAPG